MCGVPCDSVQQGPDGREEPGRRGEGGLFEAGVFGLCSVACSLLVYTLEVALGWDGRTVHQIAHCGARCDGG